MLSDQYHDAGNLNARIRLHAEFSTNDYGWFRWVFDHLNLSSKNRILELGCGPGYLWVQNSDRILKEWEITLSDFSAGMVAQARHNLRELHHPFRFEIIDAQSIPSGGNQCDVVIANHCLYHIPDRQRALSEIHRVLKPGGCFYNTTIGRTHLKEISDLLTEFNPAIEDVFKTEKNSYILENGKSQLRTWFSDIQMFRYPDSLCVTKAQPLVAFIFSMVRFG